jgi:serine/threonine protein kinase
MLSALIFLHQNNMVHDDLKPANVLLNDTIAKLANYGMCRLLESVQCCCAAAPSFFSA